MQDEQTQTAIFQTESGHAKTELSKPGVAKQIARRIGEEIDVYAQKTYDDGHRKHLGASLIGNECSRYLWYTFRWVYHHIFDGRMLRLFQRGHLEEKRFVEYLRGIGCEVWDRAEDGKQIRINDCNGHFGGSLDGVVKLPTRYGIDEVILGEFKTNGTGSGFAKLLSDNVAIAKPMHFAQMSTYGFKKGFNYAIYQNVNKNDDQIHTEIIKLDHKLGAQMIAKAERVILATEPPPKLSPNPTFYICKGCDMFEVCHNNKLVEVNCRSCKFARPVENAAWYCGHHNGIIPDDFIKQGCGAHTPIC